MYCFDMIHLSLPTLILRMPNRNEVLNTAVANSVWLYLSVLLAVGGLSHAEVIRDPITETVQDETTFFNSQMYKLLQNEKGRCYSTTAGWHVASCSDAYLCGVTTTETDEGVLAFKETPDVDYALSFILVNNERIQRGLTCGVEAFTSGSIVKEE